MITTKAKRIVTLEGTEYGVNDNVLEILYIFDEPSREPYFCVKDTDGRWFDVLDKLVDVAEFDQDFMGGGR